MLTPRQATLLCLSLPLTPSCTGACEGAGCDDLYTATRLVVRLSDGDTVSAPGQSPLEGALVLEGSESHGQGWQALPLADQLLLGLPARGEVRVVRFTNASASVDDTTLVTGVLSGESSDDAFGAALALLPQADGGTSLVVGAPELLGGGTALGAGAVYVLRDLGEGWTGELRLDLADAESPVTGVRVLSEAAFDHLGEVVAACGDLDGDGAADALVSAPWDATAAPMGGRVHALLSQRLAELPSLVRAGELERTWHGSVEGAQLGRALACADDVTGDGRADPLLGAPFADGPSGDAQGAVFLLSAVPLPDSGAVEQVATGLIYGPSAQSYFGAALATGDMTGDGLAEVVVGAPGEDGARGAVLVYDGATLAAGGSRPRLRVSGEAERDRLGTSVALADLDGDGLLDLMMGAPKHNPLGTDASFSSGTLYIIRGDAGWGGRGTRISATAADASLGATLPYLRTGLSQAAGDLDGDGRADLTLLLEVEPG